MSEKKNALDDIAKVYDVTNKDSENVICAGHNVLLNMHCYIGWLRSMG